MAFERSFPVLLAFGIGMAAYLQAVALSRLISSVISQRSQVTARVAPIASVAGLRDVDHADDASAILERNPFDSITGPLDGRVLDHPAFRGPDTETPTCDGARVVLIAASSRGGWSFAAIVGADGVPVMRREGDQVGERAVVAIGWDRVWLARDGARCELRLGAPPTGGTPTHPITKPPSEPARKTTALERDLVPRVHKTSDGSVEIDRQTANDLLERYPELVRQVRLVPEKDGLRLFGIRPGSLLAAFGLQNGDRLQEVNGFDLRDPRQAIEAYSKLSGSSHVALTIGRAGKTQNLDLRIR